MTFDLATWHPELCGSSLKVKFHGYMMKSILFWLLDAVDCLNQKEKMKWGKAVMAQSRKMQMVRKQM